MTCTVAAICPMLLRRMSGTERHRNKWRPPSFLGKAPKHEDETVDIEVDVAKRVWISSSASWRPAPGKDAWKSFCMDPTSLFVNQALPKGDVLPYSTKCSRGPRGGQNKLWWMMAAKGEVEG